MNYAVQSASSITFASKRPSFSSTHGLTCISPASTTSVRRITINVGGERFQTYEGTLDRYPGSLLGSSERRRKFYDTALNELVLPNRNKEVFDAILFFYQAGILSRPEHVPVAIFVEEIEFFQLTKYSIECSHVVEEEVVAFPGNARDTWRSRLWNFMEYPKSGRSRAFAYLSQFFLFMWIVALCAETEVNKDGVCGQTTTRDCWFIVDTVFVTWFTLDYLLHAWTAPRTLRYLFSAEGLVDLLTVLPYHVELFARVLGANLSWQFAAMKFLRVFRVFKASRHSNSFRILIGTVTSTISEFPVWILLISMHIFCFSSVLYFIEDNSGNPQFSTIPSAMWFTVITMCAVGYGDVVPQSALGRLVASLAAISGIIIVYCMPAPTLKNNFIKQNELHKKGAKIRTVT